MFLMVKGARNPHLCSRRISVKGSRYLPLGTPSSCLATMKTTPFPLTHVLCIQSQSMYSVLNGLLVLGVFRPSYNWLDSQA